jgi:hypothetical protein
MHQNLESHVQDLIIDICKVLYNKGFREVNIGAVLRLFGINSEHATKYDDSFFVLDESILELNAIDAADFHNKFIPQNQTIH